MASIEEKIKDLTNVQKLIAFDKIANPGITNAELAEKHKCTAHNIRKLLRNKALSQFIYDCERDFFKTIQLMRIKAMDNWKGYVNEGTTDRAFKASELLMKGSTDHPATMPSGSPEMPEFVDAKEKEDD